MATKTDYEQRAQERGNHMTQQQAKQILTSDGPPANVAEHIEAINTAIRALGGSATMAEVWRWAEQPDSD